jgi:hypothetical protein
MLQQKEAVTGAEEYLENDKQSKLLLSDNSEIKDTIQVPYL